MLMAFSVGRFPIPAEDVLRAAWARLTGTPSGLDPAVETVLFSVRGPRVLAALLVGSALAAAGAAYQGLFRNPLVSPDILGVSSGAALGAVLGIYLSLDVLAIQAMAFAGGLAAVAAVYLLASRVGGHDPVLVLVLAGVALGALLGAGVSLLKYLADPYNQLPAITFWLLGSLAAVDCGDMQVLLPLVVAALLPLWALRWRINLLSLGDDEARALGVETGRLRLAIVVCATLATASVVSVAGIVGWVGLLIPHVARLLAGPDFRRLLPVSILLGASFMLGVDTLARTLVRTELPLGVLTAALGTPVFVWLLAATRRHWQ
ncbi:MAG: iron ABC transporter permease [Telmatospirillum sp.]|nr:iron ABC transporter permease [Telmatospirillum sp.]